METSAFQDYYPDSFRHCYGCGSLNESGLQIRSFWDGDEAVARYMPEPYHMAFPGFVYGGLLASLIDCHCVGTASAAAYRHEGRALGTEPRFRFVTAALKVNYLKPTPLGLPLEIRARVVEIKGRKIVVQASVWVDEVETVTGTVVAVQMPEELAVNR